MLRLIYRRYNYLWYQGSVVYPGSFMLICFSVVFSVIPSRYTAVDPPFFHVFTRWSTLELFDWLKILWRQSVNYVTLCHFLGWRWTVQSFFSILFLQFQNVSSSTKFRYCDGNYYWLFTRFINFFVNFNYFFGSKRWLSV